MKIEEKFNKRSAELVEVQPPSIQTGQGLALGIKLTFFRLPGSGDGSSIAMHMTPDEALRFASRLVDAVRDTMAAGVKP